MGGAESCSPQISRIRSSISILIVRTSEARKETRPFLLRVGVEGAMHLLQDTLRTRVSGLLQVNPIALNLPHRELIHELLRNRVTLPRSECPHRIRSFNEQLHCVDVE